MGIPNLKNKTFKDFRGGRVTSISETTMSPEYAIEATNVYQLGDGRTRRRNGYTQVTTYSSAVVRMFDFQRQSDQTQYLVAQYGTKLTLKGGPGTGSETVLSTSEVSTKPFFFTTNAFGLFMTNGQHAYSMYNVSGTETLGSWGITAPSTAPTISLSGTGSGTLNLKLGRQYVFCDVAKWADAAGNSHYHIGPPSPLSAGTGPCTNDIVTLGSITASTNPRVTHKWIFSTQDLGTNQTSAFLFAAEITNATTSWADQLTDDQLDITRVAPFSTNYPAPVGQFVVEYANRKFIFGVSGTPDWVYPSGLDEVSLGIPEECFPTDVQFQVPGGIKSVTAAISFNNGGMISTPDFWFRLTGNSAATFNKQDNILSPGCVGPKAVTIAQNLMVWVGYDKRIWAWDGASNPVDLSWKIGTPMVGSKSMEDLADAQLQNVEIKVFQRGRYHFILLGCSTNPNSSAYDWIQLWDASSAVTSSGYRTLLSDGSQVGLAETDMFTADSMQTMANVLAGNTPYIYMADTTGKVFRWPDGYTDNGKNISASWTPAATDLDMPGVIKQNMWIDVISDRQDMSSGFFQIQAIAGDGINLLIPPVGCKTIPIPTQYQNGSDGTAVRALLNQDKATAVGKWIRPRFVWPDDSVDAAISGFEIYSIPITAGS
jgi:hypothetical protein